MFSSSRRQVLKIAALSTVFGALAKSTFSSGVSWAADLKLIDISGKSKDKANETAMAAAKGLGYVEDVSKADQAAVKAKAQAAGMEAKHVKCASCMFYTETEKGKAGTCTLIAGVLVHHAGYCNSWVKNPKLTPDQIKAI